MSDQTPAGTTVPASQNPPAGSNPGGPVPPRAHRGEGGPAGGTTCPSGYTQPGDAAGRPLGELLYLLALLVTAAADLAVFYQVVSVILQATPRLTGAAVAGFTAGSLALSHFAGRLMRDRHEGTAPGGRLVAWLLIVPWALLGLVAFAVRLIYASSATPASTTAVGSISPYTRNLTGAIMFLALYLASGGVAGIGEYLTRNPPRAAYRTAVRAHRRAQRRLRRSWPRYERALNVVQVHARSRVRDESNYQAARYLRLAHAEELKRLAQAEMAVYLQNPSATDGMTVKDPAPLFVPPPFPPAEGISDDSDPA